MTTVIPRIIDPVLSNTILERDVIGHWGHYCIEALNTGVNTAEFLLQDARTGAIALLAVCFFSFELVELTKEVIDQFLPPEENKKSNLNARNVFCLATYYGTLYAYKRIVDLSQLSNCGVVLISFSVYIYKVYSK